MTLKERIIELEEAAKDEGITINPGSRKDLVNSKIDPRDFAIFLLDSGNFRVRRRLQNDTAWEFQGSGKILKTAFTTKIESVKIYVDSI